MSTPFKLDSLGAVAQIEEEGMWVDIKHPSGDLLYLGGQTEKHLRIRVAGSYSKRARAEDKKNRADNLKRRGRIELDEAERRELSALSVCTLEWEAAFDDNGTPMPLTKENAQALYAAAPFIADQVNAAGGDHASFFAKR